MHIISPITFSRHTQVSRHSLKKIVFLLHFRSLLFNPSKQQNFRKDWMQPPGTNPLKPVPQELTIAIPPSSHISVLLKAVGQGWPSGNRVSGLVKGFGSACLLGLFLPGWCSHSLVASTSQAAHCLPGPRLLKNLLSPEFIHCHLFCLCPSACLPSFQTIIILRTALANPSRT